MTFGINLCYIVTPLPKQREIMERLIDHWKEGYGATYNPFRRDALGKVRIRRDVAEMVEELRQEGEPMIIGTSSRERTGKGITYKEVQEEIARAERPIHVLFGTGWGLSDEVVGLCERMLVPIRGKGDYNHLPLRVALGITLDRILGERGGRDERDS
jgi:hypothetical protein